ncbi:MAG: proline reductase cluster protein PrdD [Lachnospiraceae bacterium]
MDQLNSNTNRTTEKIMRRLIIRAFHVAELYAGDSFSLTKNSPSSEAAYQNHYPNHSFSPSSPPDTWSLTIPSNNKEYIKQLRLSSELISGIQILPVLPDRKHIPIHSIMDIIPVSVKAAGKIGEGITHTLTGVYVILTGADEEGTPVCAFGSSAGMLDEQIAFNKAGTPGDRDLIILFDVTLKTKTGLSRSGPNAAHHACDLFCQEIRSLLKARSGRECTESHCYQDIIRPGRKKVAIVKLVSGQGAMYDTHFLGSEPSSYEGSHSIIDITGAPILLSPNEYRDGAIRAMY